MSPPPTAPPTPTTEPAADRRLRVVSGSTADGDAVLALLDGTPIRVVLPTAPAWRHQVLALALVDLLGRLFPLITIDCDSAASAHPLLPPGPPLLRPRLEEAAGHGALGRTRPPGAPPITIIVGDAVADGPIVGPVVHVDGAGWQSYNGTTPPRWPDRDWPMVPVGPLAAACRAAAQATAAALHPVSGAQVPPASAYASALTHTASPDPIDDGHAGSAGAWQNPAISAVMAGAGSIGGAAAYALAMTPSLAGTLTVTDPQQLEDKNLDRALLATAQTTAQRLWKVDAVQRALDHHEALRVDTYRGTLTDWVASHPEPFPLPLVLTAVDSRQARTAVQDCLPLDVVNAACHPDEITVSGHRTGTGPCLCCLHMEQVMDTTTTRARLLERATGLNGRMILHYLTADIPLEADVLRQIERHRGLPPESLSQYENATLEDLRAGELLYGATAVGTPTGTVAVAAPYVTALAGVLLAAEALKSATPALAGYRLGPDGGHIKYEERVQRGPLQALLTSPPRWAGSECLCQSSRRQRLLTTRYATFG
ncbi:hypothetical protein E4P41_13885 [Geodermatophilus sp. DF01-2]|uniref:ThiF family adenylyltransferase n=1 Tax=Geodermatophilus sp. DF01-2 TaxID=2559610 RepID=UPI00107498CA|nr:ThiF family adenylyltransferase [Geodermatophilus sp. DF01_2]TFV57745.1 hypothetical protein E4P41_13885 [Geodermatophilus sp. DF01_2]